MKRLFAYAAIAASFTACYQQPATEEEIIDNDGQTKYVQFVMKGIEVDYSSRATITSEGMTDLWVWEGQTLLKHQTSTDEDFGNPTIALKYGSHDLTFVASKAEGQIWADGVLSMTKVKDTFGSAMNVTVSSGSGSSRQVELKRVTAQVQWSIEDQVPSGVAKCSLTCTNYLGIDASLNGVSSTTYSASVNATSWVGGTKTLSTNIMPQTYATESEVTANIRFDDASGNEIVSHTTETTVKSNRVTNIHGNFFGGSGANAVSLLIDWDTQKDVEL